MTEGIYDIASGKEINAAAIYEDAIKTFDAFISTFTK
jgi:hypothetical protein